eukprot:TRINITY_DN1050_c0_g1_i2.p1 TRINITY_DN1050_c0_g1~~TRINITY_DN1050_c0_g1_i2.p1  ORF type:complete len:964 (+),score=176.67 TRINITY_DN1050_c0_g1_i2:798-3689(+)
MSLSPDRSLLLVVWPTTWRLYLASNCNEVEANETDFHQQGGLLKGAFLSQNSFVIWTKCGKGYTYYFNNSSELGPGTKMQAKLAKSLHLPGSVPVTHFASADQSPRYLVSADQTGNVYLWTVPAVEEYENIVEDTIFPRTICRFQDSWKNIEIEKEGTVTATLIVEDTLQMISGSSKGYVKIYSLPTDDSPITFVAHKTKVTALLTVEASPSLLSTEQKRHLVTGSEDGSIKIWEFKKERVTEFPLLHTFSFHTGAVTTLLQLNTTPPPTLPLTGPPSPNRNASMNGSSRLVTSQSFLNARKPQIPPSTPPPAPEDRGTIFSIGEDRSVALISLQSMNCRRLFTGHTAPITSLRIRQDQDYLLIGCSDESVTIWELSSGLIEGRIVGQQAQEILATSEDLSRDYKPKLLQARGTSSIVLKAEDTPIQVIILNVKKLLSELYLIYKPASQNATQSSIDVLQTHTYKAVSYLLPWRLDPDLDALLLKDLQLSPPNPNFTYGIRGAEGKLSLLLPSKSNERWVVSGTFTAIQSLAIIAISKALLYLSEAKNACSQLLSYICAMMPEKCPRYVLPSHVTLARYWQDPVDDVLYSARSLMISTMERCKPQELTELAQQISAQLKTSQGFSKSLRIVLLGIIGCEYPNSIDRDIGQLVVRGLTKLLQQEGQASFLQGAAAELIGKGYEHWRPYIDKQAQIMQKLFHLTQTSRTLKDIAQAALLNVGAHEPAHFVSVLTDAALNSSHSSLVSSSSSTSSSSSNLSSTSVGGSGSALHLIATLVRKNPSSLLPQLPRLVEAMVQCLDTSNMSLRESLLPASNEILKAIVQKYPMISFHKETQRLAVGTSKNLVNIYDLKTAVKSLVLDGHNGSVAAVAFNLDGKSLATYSPDDSLIRLWNTGPSPSFFRFGGATNNTIVKDPFNSFSIASHVKRTLTPQFLLESVQLDWSSARKLVLKRSWEAEMVIHVNS